jgi:hypothetical protein
VRLVLHLRLARYRIDAIHSLSFPEICRLSDLRSKIAKELLWAPSVVLPVVAGASSWLISWAAGGINTLNVVGLVGVIVGVGWFATRMIFQTDEIAAKVLRQEQEKAVRAEEAKLDNLQQRLRVDRDFRTKDYLTLLRTCRSEFEEFATRPGIAIQSQEIVKQVQQLFWSSVDQLERSLKLYSLSERLVGEQREKVLDERVQTAAKHYQDLISDEQNTDLSSIRDELDASIRVAKRIEERMKELEGNSNMDAYLKE